MQVFFPNAQRVLVRDGVDARVVEEEVDFHAGAEGAGEGRGERGDGGAGAGIADEDVCCFRSDGLQVCGVGGGGADAGDDYVGAVLGELADEC